MTRTTKLLINEQDVRKVTAFEVLESLHAVSYFAETHGDKQMNVMLLIDRKSGNTQVTKRKTEYYPYVF